MPPSEMPGSTPPVAKREPVGPLVGVIIIVCMLLVGAAYFWGKKLNEQQPLPYIPDDQLTAFGGQ